MKLHGFFRSGSSHRVRIALNLKGLPYERVPVDLRTEQHRGADELALNPQGLVPALAAIVGCDIHPVNNRRILEALRHDFGADEAAVQRWCATWIAAGFDAIEALLAAHTARGDFCFGDAPTLADVYLVPQVESARRFQVDLAPWPRISAVDAACNELAAFRDAAPAAQPDAR